MQATGFKPSSDAILSCSGVNRWFGGVRAVADVSLDIRQGEIFGIGGLAEPGGVGGEIAHHAEFGFEPGQSGLADDGGDVVEATGETVVRHLPGIGLATEAEGMSVHNMESFRAGGAESRRPSD